MNRSITEMIYEDKINRAKNRLLSFSILMLIATFLFFISFLTYTCKAYFAFYLIIALVYYGLFRIWNKHLLLTTIISIIFYCIHTSIELFVLGLNFEFLKPYGYETNNDHAFQLRLIFVDIARIMYPIVRFSLVIMFIIPLFYLNRIKS